jgi:recombinational DNA repair protein RecR
MAKMTTFGGNVASVPARTCECVLCGDVQEHDVCNSCHMSEPDGSLDCELLLEMIHDDLADMDLS